MQTNSKNKEKKFEYCIFDETYDEETYSSLLEIVNKTVNRTKKRHSLLDDPKIYFPSVCRRGKLRYDIRLPLNSAKHLCVSDHVRHKVSSLLGSDFVSRPPRVLIAYKGAEAQEFHTDIDPLFGDENSDISLPSFYLTLIVALNDVQNLAMGPTEFYDGYLALLKTNQSVLFDGLTVHRGGAAAVDRPALVYQVFHRRWYSDANEK